MMSNFAQNGERVENAGGLRIFFRSWRPEESPRGFVVIVPGFNAHSAWNPGIDPATAGMAART